MTRRLGILQFARLASQRLPGKHLMEIGGERLIDIGTRYMSRLRDATGAVPILACSPSDEPLVESARRHHVVVLPLSTEMKHSEHLEDLIAALVPPVKKLCDWVWHPNIPCRPFSRLETGIRILDYCRTAERPFVCATQKRGIVWAEGKTIIGAGRTANTKSNPVYFELSHLGYGFPVEALAYSEEELAAACEPISFEIDWAERIDIDVLQDLEFARVVAASGRISCDR